MSKSKIAVLKEVITDPGVGFCLGGVALFASTSVLGLAACAAAFGISAVAKTLSVSDTGFAQKFPKIAKVILDDKVPLLANSAAMLTVGVSALVSGAWIPAIAGLLFTVANANLAVSLDSAKRNAGKESVPDAADQKKFSFKRTMSLLVKRPDLYLASGLAVSMLLAGGAAIWAVPAVAAGFGVAFRNILQNKPESSGHPKLYTAAATAFSAGVGFVSGNWQPAIAYLMNSCIFINIERTISPGGGRQMLRDIKNSFTGFFRGKKTAKAAAPPPACYAPPESRNASTLPDKPLADPFKAAHESSPEIKDSPKNVSARRPQPGQLA